MTWGLVTGVRVSIILWKHIHVMEDVTIKRPRRLGFQKTDIHHTAFVKNIW